MSEHNHNSPHSSSSPRVINWIPLSEILAELEFPRGLESDALLGAERYGPIRGNVRRLQREWSRAIDQIEASRQNSLAADRAA